MIDSARLVADLKKQLKLLEADLRQRADDPETPWAEGLKLEYERAFARERTARTWSEWSAGELSQAAVAWIVSATFIRFCEDNDLLAGASIDDTPSPAPWLAGPGERLDRAVENQTAYFRANPTQTARDWLMQPFRALSALPAGRGLLDPDHSPVWSITISAQAAESLLNFWRATDADGALVHDFTDPALGTRFLGDIYQDLSDYAKSTFALLQTPIFVEEFILDRTLTPAIAEFGLEGLKLIDPTCGSGHFLLGAFDRLVEAWAAKAPAMDARTRAQTALSSIHGVDLNPFAVAIARFRLTVAALLASGERSLVSAPAFAFKLAVGDSLLRWKADDVTLDLGDQEETFAYSTEDIREYAGILDTNQYHVVVGNPPYITVKDRALNETYRRLYKTCKGKYALSVPFMELFFELALRATEAIPAGYVGKITSNSFMKREFGIKIIEDFLSGYDEFDSPVDLTTVVDTSGAYIPGHGTPTVILFGRRRRKQGDRLRAVLGVRGEPGQPFEPANGFVWRDIVDHLDEPGYNGSYVSVSDLSRETLAKHPWSLSGGGSSDLFVALQGASSSKLGSKLRESIGPASFTGNDDAFLVPNHWNLLERVEKHTVKRMVAGDLVRDWRTRGGTSAIAPYGRDFTLLHLEAESRWARHLWRNRTILENGIGFGGVRMKDSGQSWWGWYRWIRDRYLEARALTFAFVATHNHFVFERGDKVFSRSAPVIKLPAAATDDDHLELLGLLNSSVAGFWLKQVSHNKGSTVSADGARTTLAPWEDFYEFTSTKLQEFPIPPGYSPERARRIDELAATLGGRLSLAQSLPRVLGGHESVDDVRAARSAVVAEMVSLQEELDWEVYCRYGLCEESALLVGDPVPIRGGQRAFEIVLARKLADGAGDSAWFERHGHLVTPEIPTSWPEEYRTVVQRRLDLIDSDPMIRLLEQPEYKRRWAMPTWDVQLREAVTTVVLDRFESRDLWSDDRGRPVTRSVAQLAELVKNDSDLRSAIVLLTGDSGANIQATITSLIADEAVPAAAQQRYKPSGLTKFRGWQKVWDMQRAEDRGERVTIPVPPKYAQADFTKTTYWKARGKLDVPKERFIAYPGARRGNDDTAVYGWAGWNHAEQALAASSLLVDMAGAGASSEQLMPIFAALIELEPWLVQWHSEVDPAYGVSPAVAVAGVVDNQLARAGITRDDVAAWRPAAATRGRRAGASTASIAPTVEDTP